jgi:hypothetical protein
MGFLAAIPAWVSLAAAGAGAAVQIDQANERDAEARQDAAKEKDAAKAHAENISRARRKQVASARAATAASGTALDEFSEINTNDIERSGALDEQMTLLTGNRRAESQLYGQGDGARAAAINGAGDLLSTGYQIGWKKPKGKA